MHTQRKMRVTVLTYYKEVSMFRKYASKLGLLLLYQIQKHKKQLSKTSMNYIEMWPRHWKSKSGPNVNRLTKNSKRCSTITKLPSYVRPCKLQSPSICRQSSPKTYKKLTRISKNEYTFKRASAHYHQKS